MIIWDENKDITLKLQRGISFEEISELILNKQYIDIIKNPTRANQRIFIIKINNYIFAVPFVIDKDLNIVLKTAYPSRKLQKKYRGESKWKKLN